MKYRDDTVGHRAFALPGASMQYGPDKVVEVEHIDLHLEPDIAGQRLRGVCTTTVRALDEPVSRLVLDAVDLAVTSIECNGAVLPFESRNGKLDVCFTQPLAPGERTSFAIAYSANRPRHGLFFVEPSPDYPEKVPHAWTQSQDENARYWFPCLDYPHAKQTTSATVIVPKGHFALANGALVERRDDGETTVFRYRQDVPHSTYLMTLVAGPFAEVAQGEAGSGKTAVWYYVLPGREADGERAFGNTPAMIDAFERRIGTPYPYARYSQIAVSDFIFGGMENTTATTQTDRTLHDAVAHVDFSSDPLVSHELAHQWFGDLLTCRDWSHAWLNEGFATFFESVWKEDALGYDEYEYDVFGCVERYLDEDGNRYRRPIVCNQFRDPIELFDRHLYEKGGAVLHMLRGDLGDARFWRSIRHYVASNARRNVETIDLIRAIEESSGRNMREFFDQWIFRGGHPELEFNVRWDAAGKTATVTIDQKQTVDASNPAYRFDLTIGLCAILPSRAARDAGPEALPGEKRVRIFVERAHETITIPLDEEPKLVRIDPGAFILGSATYALPAEFNAATLRADPGVTARIRAARALAKDGSRASREALQSTFTSEAFYGVLSEAAAALGATKAPWAREILIGALAHEHPKVRRAVAAALGNFRDSGTAHALLEPARSDTSYFVRSAALAALGKTRDAAAFEVLRNAVRERTWNGIVESGAVRGLAELADARAVDLIVAAAQSGGDEGLRRAAAAALGRCGELLSDARSRVVDALGTLLDDEMFLVQLAAISAAESLEDPRLNGALDRLASSAFDGRVRRDAAEAASRIRESQKVPSQVSSLRTDLDALREDQRKLQEKIEALSRS